MNSSKLLRHISKSVRQQIMPSSNLSAFREEFKEAKHGMIFNFKLSYKSNQTVSFLPKLLY